MQRRAFLQLGALAAALPRPAAANPRAAQADDSWTVFRQAFALEPNLLHFSGFLLASHPKPVRDAIAHYRSALDRNPASAVHTHLQPRDLAVRQAAARYFNTHAHDIALTDSTTQGLGLLYSGLILAPDDEILTTDHDHYATHYALALRQARLGTPVRKIQLYADSAQAQAGALVDRVRQGIGPATRVLAITWVHSGTGLKLPVADISAAVAQLNTQRPAHKQVLVCVDGVHGLGVENPDLQAMGCDFFVAGCHKWLFGPRGTGVVWGKPAAWAQLAPTIPAFEWEDLLAWMEERPSASPRAWQATPGGFHSFEHRWALDAAFDLHAQLGPARVTERIHSLNTQMKEALAALPNVRVVTPAAPALSAGFVSFTHASLGPQALVDKLSQRNVMASVSPYRTAHARFAPSLLNTPGEVQEAAQALASIEAS